jgi:Tol biopolymer transport system component
MKKNISLLFASMIIFSVVVGCSDQQIQPTHPLTFTVEATNNLTPTKTDNDETTDTLTPSNTPADIPVFLNYQISSNSLEGLNPITGRYQVVVKPRSESSSRLISYSASDDGKQIALVYEVDRGINYTLELFDATTQKTTVVYRGVSQGHRLLGMSISPNGQWLVYIPQGTLPAESKKRRNGLDKVLPRPLMGGGVGYGVVYLIQTSSLEHNFEIDFCRLGTYAHSKILWSPDSQSFVWVDERGLLLSKLNQSTTLILSNRIDGWSTKIYSQLSWSPTGRYLLIEVGYFEGSSLAILDVETGRIGSLDDSFCYVNCYALLVEWMEDGRLLVTRQTDPPKTEIWRIDASNENLLVLDASE